MEEIKRYIEENKQRFLDELFELIRIPSISSEPEHKADMYRCAEQWTKLMLAAGADRAEVYETEGNPVAYGEKIVDPALPTVLVYGHMDVMPVDPVELWNTKPFEPVVADGKIWARGADDDKGQSFMHAKAFEYMVRSGKLNCNVKFMIEGEEEIGSPSLPKFCRDHKEMLKADVILVSDTSMIARDVPSITTGLRGLAYWQVEVTGPNADLHSGIFGGAVANPINVLCKMIAGMQDEQGRVTIPGFYDDVLVVSDEERAKMAKAPFDLEKYKASLGVKEVKGEEGFTTTERTGIRPTFDVCGIWGGYTGEGSKTVLPSKAYAKISCRLVPNQKHEKIALLFKEYFESIAPDYVTVKVGIRRSVRQAADSGAFRRQYSHYRHFRGGVGNQVHSYGIRFGCGRHPLSERELPLGAVLQWSPNENYPLEQFFNGITTIPLFYKYFGEEMKK